jgi:UPF0755 protein
LPAVARRTRKAATLSLSLLVLLALALAGGRWWVADMLQPVKPGTAELVTVEIPAGASTHDVAQLLHTRDLIKEPTLFRYYARYRKLDSQLKPGEYELTAAMTPEEILQKLARGEVVIRRFTIPEGLTVEQIADVLASRKVVSQERFLQVAAASHLADKYLPQDVHLRQPLEGYLFPATYEYKRGVTEEEIVAMMFARFEQVWTPALQARAQEQQMTVHQVVTLASIVEKEAQVETERARIGGVYLNRLQIGMKLDADPAVRYAVSKAPGEELTLKDLDVDSPYNSYRNAGLPPGPIASPGEASIRAALWPEKHDFWYFVARADGSGEHFFAATLAEQDANIEKARENEQKHK